MRTVDIIPSKSDAHRGLICAALSETECKVICSRSSEDIQATKQCLQALAENREEMLCGESGSTFRFLLPLMGALGHKAAFQLEGRLSERPLSPLYEELVSHGCILSPQGQVPFVLEGQLQPGEYYLPGNVSSQYISGLLFALPLLKGNSRIIVEGNLESKGYVDLTVNVLRKFGIAIQEVEDGYRVEGNQRYKGPSTYQVEGDWSNGTFWLAAGALLSEGICVKGLSTKSLQGDRQILHLLRELGASVDCDADEIHVKADGRLHAIDIDASLIPDMVPALAVLASTAIGTTVIKNAGRLRIKESDRLSTITQVMNRLGADIEELPEGLLIRGKDCLQGGTVHAHGDHRIAMMAAIASLNCEGKVILTGADAVKKSYPGFFADMEELGIVGNVERK